MKKMAMKFKHVGLEEELRFRFGEDLGLNRPSGGGLVMLGRQPRKSCPCDRQLWNLSECGGNVKSLYSWRLIGEGQSRFGPAPAFLSSFLFQEILFRFIEREREMGAAVNGPLTCDCMLHEVSVLSAHSEWGNVPENSTTAQFFTVWYPWNHSTNDSPVLIIYKMCMVLYLHNFIKRYSKLSKKSRRHQANCSNELIKKWRKD